MFGWLSPKKYFHNKTINLRPIMFNCHIHCCTLFLERFHTERYFEQNLTMSHSVLWCSLIQLEYNSRLVYLKQVSILINRKCLCTMTMKNIFLWCLWILYSFSSTSNRVLFLEVMLHKRTSWEWAWKMARFYLNAPNVWASSLIGPTIAGIVFKECWCSSI